MLPPAIQDHLLHNLLIYIPLMTSDVNTFSCVYWSFMYLLLTRLFKSSAIIKNLSFYY